MRGLPRDETAEPVSRDQILRRERGRRNIHFPCSADTSRIGNLNRLIHTLLYYVMTIHTCGAFSRMHRALDGWMLARYFNSPYFCTICGLEKLEIVDQNWLERLSNLLLRTLVVGRRQQSESIDGVKEV